MRKEVAVAIGIGFALGLLITGGFWWFSRNPLPIKQKPADMTTPTATVTPASEQETAAKVIPLTIDSPAEGAIIADGQAEISGVTVPGAAVVFIYPEGETIAEADEDGKFAVDIELQGGSNDIVISAYDYQGNKKETTLTVVYSTAKI